MNRIIAIIGLLSIDKVCLAGQQQLQVVDLRAARLLLYLQAVFFIGAVGGRLIPAAVFGLRKPVGAIADLFQRRGRQWHGQQSGTQQRGDGLLAGALTK